MFKKFENYLYQDDFNKIPDLLLNVIKKTLIEKSKSISNFEPDEIILIKIIFLNANEPFIKQEEIANILKIDKKNFLYIQKKFQVESKLMSQFMIGLN